MLETMLRITVPLYAGTHAANGYLRTVEGVEGNVVFVDCREILSLAPTFAEQMVCRLLIMRQAAELVIYGASATFFTAIRQAADRHGVGDRVRRARPLEELIP